MLKMYSDVGSFDILNNNFKANTIDSLEQNIQIQKVFELFISYFQYIFCRLLKQKSRRHVAKWKNDSFLNLIFTNFEFYW